MSGRAAPSGQKEAEGEGEREEKSDETTEWQLPTSFLQV